MGKTTPLRNNTSTLPSLASRLPKQNEFVRPGFELGYKEGGRHFIHNHLRFNVLVHPSDGEYGNAARAGGGAAGGRRRLQQAGDGARTSGHFLCPPFLPARRRSP